MYLTINLQQSVDLSVWEFFMRSTSVKFCEILCFNQSLKYRCWSLNFTEISISIGIIFEEIIKIENLK